MSNLSYTLYSPDETIPVVREKITNKFSISAETFITDTVLVVREDNDITAVGLLNPEQHAPQLFPGGHREQDLRQELSSFYPVFA
jgi:hypothetical protein